MSVPYVWIMAMLSGVVLVQPVLFAEWAVLGPGPAIYRVPLTIAAAAAVAFCGVYPERNTKPTSAPNFQFYWYIWGIALPAAATILMLVRQLAGWKTKRVTDIRTNRMLTNQFSLKYLLLLTTVCAVFLGTVHFLASHRWLTIHPVSMNELNSILIDISVVMLPIVPVFVIPLVALTPRLTAPIVIGIPLAWAALSWLALENVVGRNVVPDRFIIAVDIALLQSGAALAGLLSALMVRVAGYRLVSRKSLTSSPPASES
jgi:hypothetical protein